MTESILIAAMKRIDEEKVLSITKNMLDKGILPANIIEEVRKGITLVRKKYEEGKYFLSDLMMSAEIFSEVAGILKQNGNLIKYRYTTPVIVGTVKNDIHDIGKNIIVQLLQFRGFNVIDVGVDVSPEDFVDAAVESKARILFMSGLLTLSYESMKNTVLEFKKSNMRDSITIVIGGLVDERVRKFVGADYCTRDSHLALNLCQNILASEHTKVLKDKRAVSR